MSIGFRSVFLNLINFRVLRIELKINKSNNLIHLIENAIQLRLFYEQRRVKIGPLLSIFVFDIDTVFNIGHQIRKLKWNDNLQN